VHRPLLLEKRSLRVCVSAQARTGDALVDKGGALAHRHDALLLVTLLLEQLGEDVGVVLEQVLEEEAGRAVLDRELGLVLRAEDTAADRERELLDVELGRLISLGAVDEILPVLDDGVQREQLGRGEAADNRGNGRGHVALLVGTDCG
jgi:hypothetical protein